MRSCLLVCIAVLLLSACTAGHSVRTIGKGNFGIETTVGGPMLTNLGPAIPAPNIFIGGRAGLHDTLDVSAAYNLTSPIIPGLALDLITGIHWVPVQPGVGRQSTRPEKGGSIATAVTWHWMSDFETGFLVIPAVEFATGYRVHWFNPYVGASLAFNFYRPRGESPVSMVSPFAGVDFIFTQMFTLAVRVTLFDVAWNYYGSQVEWVFASDHPEDGKRYAPVGISLGGSWDFRRKP